MGPVFKIVVLLQTFVSLSLSDTFGGTNISVSLIKEDGHNTAYIYNIKHLEVPDLKDMPEEILAKICPCESRLADDSLGKADSIDRKAGARAADARTMNDVYVKHPGDKSNAKIEELERKFNTMVTMVMQTQIENTQLRELTTKQGSEIETLNAKVAQLFQIVRASGVRGPSSLSAFSTPFGPVRPVSSIRNRGWQYQPKYDSTRFSAYDLKQININTEKKRRPSPRLRPRPTKASNGCPVGFERHGQKCYLFVCDVMNWVDAQTHCNKQGAYLVEIDSKDEQTLVTDLMRRNGSYGLWVWTGGSDVLEEGHWRWMHSNRSITAPTFWASVGMTNTREQNYLCLRPLSRRDPGLWEDCVNQRVGFVESICEADVDDDST